MKTLETILSTLDKKIRDLKIVFDEYQKITLANSQADIVDGFEHLKEDITSIDHENATILEALSLYIQKRVDVVTTMSVIAKYCLLHKDFLSQTKNIITYLEGVYGGKSEYNLMYLDCYLNSSLAALNIACKYNFTELLKNIKDTTDVDISGVPVANLQMQNALTFLVLACSPVDVNKMVKVLKKGKFDGTNVISKAIEDAHTMNPAAADNFVSQNKEWLQVDMKLNLAIFEAEDWTIVDHVTSPIKKKPEDTKTLFHENLIKEYSDILKVFKDTKASKTILDLSCITEDFKSLSGSIANLSIELGMKESLNLSNIPLVVGVEDITAHDTEVDVLNLIGNSNTEAE